MKFQGFVEFYGTFCVVFPFIAISNIFAKMHQMSI